MLFIKEDADQNVQINKSPYSHLLSRTYRSILEIPGDLKKHSMEVRQTLKMQASEAVSYYTVKWLSVHE